MRFGPELPWLGDAALFENVQGAPSWFTHDATLCVLGVLAAMEVMASKNADARAAMEQLDEYLKPTMAALTFVGVIQASDVQFINQAVQPAGLVDYPLMVAMVPGVWFLTRCRRAVLGLLAEADEDDDLGIQKLISWAEDVGVVGGLVLLVLFPIAMIVLIGLVSCGLVLARRRVEAREQKTKITCANCGEKIYPCAVTCASCQAPVAAPRGVGWLGQATSDITVDPASHPYRLVEKKRCPVCAQRLTQRCAPQPCPVCGCAVLGEQAFVDQYMKRMNQKLPGVLLVCTGLSFIPVVGLIPGVIYYRVQLVSPLRRYLPFGRRLLLKGVVGLVLFVLIAFQWVPIAGAASVPLMAIVNYTVYRRSLQNQLATAAAPG